MKIRVKSPSNVIVGTGDPVPLRAGVVEAEAGVVELLVSLGVAEPVEEKENKDAAEP